MANALTAGISEDQKNQYTLFLVIRHADLVQSKPLLDKKAVMSCKSPATASNSLPGRLSLGLAIVFGSSDKVSNLQKPSMLSSSAWHRCQAQCHSMHSVGHSFTGHSFSVMPFACCLQVVLSSALPGLSGKSGQHNGSCYRA